MIRLERVRSVEHVPAVFRGAGRVKRELELLTKKRDGTLELKSSQWKPAKDALGVESNRKCAYCESMASAAYPCDVEHVRPKDVHWWLAWAYENYAFSCFLCNNKKRNQFPRTGAKWPAPKIAGKSDAQLAAIAGSVTPDPLDPAAGLTLAKFTALHAAEKAGLPHPYLDDVTPLVGFRADDVLEQVLLEPADDSVKAKRVVATLVQLCDINRDDVARDRWLRYELLRTIANAWSSGSLPPALHADNAAQLKKAMEPSRPYSAMARHFIQRLWKLALP